MEKEGVIDIDGFKLGYKVEGEGMPALVIGSTVYYPRTFAGDLRQSLQLIFIDHRGFVAPPPGDWKDEDFELAVLLNDIETIRKALGLERFVVVGHSGHAFLALEYAKNYPQYVAQVVMIGASPDYSAATTQARWTFFEQDTTPERKAAFEASMAQLPERLAADPNRRFVHLCLSAGPASWYDYRYDAMALWEGVYTNRQVFDYVWGVVFRDIDITAGLETLDVPVFLALGRYDYLTGLPFLWDAVRHQFKNLTIRIFEKSAHTPQLEEPDRFNQELVRWLHTGRAD
ncbi:alpha/beta fold hydrolase [Larkinella insperata]|uniref:Alpha/beta fold hydrolase n=1 Tax=Larkinella insperata TaxID=332158 RepID=A0ABW3QMZ9_9BACT|nr:alpha/beta hydrolase [Larkinella insperata]